MKFQAFPQHLFIGLQHAADRKDENRFVKMPWHCLLPGREPQNLAYPGVTSSTQGTWSSTDCINVETYILASGLPYPVMLRADSKLCTQGHFWWGQKLYEVSELTMQGQVPPNCTVNSSGPCLDL